MVLGFRYQKTGGGMTAVEVEEALGRIGYRLRPGDIVLIRTEDYKHYGEPDYANIHPGMTRGSTLWLIERGIN